MIESRDQTTYSHSSHKCSARGSNQHWPELYHDATRQGTVKPGCSYAKWRWVHYLHGSSSSRELICLAQGQHGAASATVIDPMTSRFGFPCFTTTSPRSLFVLCLFVCLFVCLNWCLTSQSKANGHVGTLPRVVWDFYQKLGRHDIQ